VLYALQNYCRWTILLNRKPFLTSPDLRMWDTTYVRATVSQRKETCFEPVFLKVGDLLYGDPKQIRAYTLNFST
jgi:hypothetical protein